MRCIRIDGPKVRRERSWLEPANPVDPRDPDVVRVKGIERGRLQEVIGRCKVSGEARLEFIR
jgi:hypothetical protein